MSLLDALKPSPPQDDGSEIIKPQFKKPFKRIITPDGIELEEFRDVISAGYQHYMKTGVLDPEEIFRLSGVPLGKVEIALRSEAYKTAMANRGIIMDPRKILTQKMDYVLQIISDPHDGLTMAQKLKKAGISNTTYQGYLRNPFFKNQIDALSERLLSNNHEALVSLSKKVGEGDIQAIKFQLEVNSRYNPRAEAVMSQTELISRVMDIIVRRVTDKDTLLAISGDFQQLSESISDKPTTLILEQ